MLVKEKKEISFKEVCEELDLREKKLLSGESKLLSIGEVWEKLKNRKNTFLTEE